MRKSEINRAVAYFTHEGESYKIHERTNRHSDGTPCTRRFIVRRADGKWSGEARNVREAREVLDTRNSKS